MRTIYKYPIEIENEQLINIPSGANIISAQIQNGIPCIWAMVDTGAKNEEVKIRVFGTGHEIPSNLILIPISTIQKCGLVWHLFVDATAF